MARYREPRDIPPGAPRPETRREIVERWPEGVQVRATGHEPRPDEEPTDWRNEQVRPDRIELRHHGLVVGTVAMVVVSLLFFWAPVFNGLVAGVMGGFFARRMGPALLAAAMTAVAVPGAFYVLYYAFQVPDILRLFYGLGFGGWSALHAVSLALGAVSGVASRPSWRTARRQQARS
jgi:hypothetical protein